SFNHMYNGNTASASARSLLQGFTASTLRWAMLSSLSNRVWAFDTNRLRVTHGHSALDCIARYKHHISTITATRRTPMVSLCWRALTWTSHEVCRSLADTSA